jgi:hypothetical protein
VPNIIGFARNGFHILQAAGTGDGLERRLQGADCIAPGVPSDMSGDQFREGCSTRCPKTFLQTEATRPRTAPVARWFSKLDRGALQGKGNSRLMRELHNNIYEQRHKITFGLSRSDPTTGASFM